MSATLECIILVVVVVICIGVGTIPPRWCGIANLIENVLKRRTDWIQYISDGHWRRYIFYFVRSNTTTVVAGRTILTTAVIRRRRSGTVRHTG